MKSYVIKTRIGLIEEAARIETQEEANASCPPTTHDTFNFRHRRAAQVFFPSKNSSLNRVSPLKYLEAR